MLRPPRMPLLTSRWMSTQPLRKLTTLCRRFTVLALESSADDTCAAIVTSDRRILSNIVIKQLRHHAPFKGIHPYVALQAHQQHMPIAVRDALQEAKLTMSDIDGIAFTRGPGMPGCLAVAAGAAKSLAAALNLPVVGVNHMQAHALISMLTTEEAERPQFPFLTLLISGGHSLLVLATSLTQFKILATTHDETVGQAYDKVARLLSIDFIEKYGPGLALATFCSHPASEFKQEHDEFSEAKLRAVAASFPTPLPGKLEFSFAALHSHLDRFLRSKKNPILDDYSKWVLANAFQASAARQLDDKLQLALRWCLKQGHDIRHVVVGGGVASNTFLRGRLLDSVSKFHGVGAGSSVNLVFPPAELCTDNAVMIAWASMHRFQANEHDSISTDILPKWSLEDLSQ